MMKQDIKTDEQEEYIYLRIYRELWVVEQSNTRFLEWTCEGELNTPLALSRQDGFQPLLWNMYAST